MPPKLRIFLGFIAALWLLTLSLDYPGIALLLALPVGAWLFFSIEDDWNENGGSRTH